MKPGHKVAICGKNSAEWAIIFIACLTYGAVAVPILHEFNSESITNLVNHSEAALLFADKAILGKLDEKSLKTVTAAFYISETEWGSRSRAAKMWPGLAANSMRYSGRNSPKVSRLPTWNTIATLRKTLP